MGVNLGHLGARLTMGRASAARMRDTPAAAATAAENSTAAARYRTELHRTAWGEDVRACLSLVMVLGSLAGCMRGAGAWMLGCSDGSHDVYGITRLPHVLQVAQASRYWMTESEQEQVLRIANTAASPWPAQPLGGR